MSRKKCPQAPNAHRGPWGKDFPQSAPVSAEPISPPKPIRVPQRISFSRNAFVRVGEAHPSSPASPAHGVTVQKLAALAMVAPRMIERNNRVPDRIEPITAWRAWGVEMHEGRLVLAGLGKRVNWLPKKPLTATCVQSRSWLIMPWAEEEVPAHYSPDAKCNCGIWGFPTLNGLLKMLSPEYPQQIRVVGEVSLWGRIIECENGFRAQYAYPKELWLLDNSLEELGYTYGVPVRTA